MANAHIGISGIDVEGIGMIKQAISQYKDAIKSTRDLGITEYQIKENLKGATSQKEIENLSNNLKAKVGDLLKLMDKLSDSLSEVQKNYETQDISLGRSIAGGANKLKS